MFISLNTVQDVRRHRCHSEAKKKIRNTFSFSWRYFNQVVKVKVQKGFILVIVLKVRMLFLCSRALMSCLCAASLFLSSIVKSQKVQQDKV